MPHCPKGKLDSRKKNRRAAKSPAKYEAFFAVVVVFFMVFLMKGAGRWWMTVSNMATAALGWRSS
jgi:hypothetical protein